METFNIHILGCGSAKPSLRHNSSCQIVDIRGKLYMIDCGEGAQVEFTRQRLNMNRLGHIFISHNHGDHVFGLPGFISTMGLLGRTAELHIHGPQQVEKLLQVTLETYCQGMDYEVHFYPIDTTLHQLVYEDRSMEVWSLPLKHRVPCCGYLFREKPGLPHIRREIIDAYGIPTSQINNIKAGASWTLPDGTHAHPFLRLLLRHSLSARAEQNDTRLQPTVSRSHLSSRTGGTCRQIYAQHIAAGRPHRGRRTSRPALHRTLQRTNRGRDSPSARSTGNLPKHPAHTRRNGNQGEIKRGNRRETTKISPENALF